MGETKLHWWSSPYSFSEKLDFLKYRIRSPKDSSDIIIPKDLQRLVTGHSFESDKENQREISVIFTGDLMPFGKIKPTHSRQLDDFFASADYIVFNLEGVVTERKRILALSHSHALLVGYLRDSFKQDIVLNVANNHASDFGGETFSRQNQRLRDEGFSVVGDTAAPLLIEGKIGLWAATFLSNQTSVLPLSDFSTSLQAPGQKASAHTYNIFMPHWGYEMHLYPQQQQITLYKNVVPDIYDSIIGNHSHVPQQIYYSNHSFLASSLGNFCYLNYNPNHWGGSLLKCTFLIDNNCDLKPTLSSIEVCHIRQSIVDDQLLITTADEIDYHTSRRSIRHNPWKYMKDILK